MTKKKQRLSYFQNLLPEREYKFRVRAQNVYGIGEPSAESDPVTVGLINNNGKKMNRGG